MIPSNFTIVEVLKLPSLTLEELKEYVYNLDILSFQQQIEDLENKVYELKEELSELQYNYLN